MARVDIVNSIRIDDLAECVCFGLDFDDIIDFVMCIDSHMADSVFTGVLIGRLKSALEKENS